MKILTCDCETCGLLHEQCIVNYCICRDVWTHRTRAVMEMGVGMEGGSWVGRWMHRVEGRYFFQVGCKPGFNVFSQVLFSGGVAARI